MTLRGKPALAMAACLAVCGVTLADNDPAARGALDERTALEQSQAAIGRLLDNHRLIDSRGAELSLHELRGKPLVISLIYTSCHHTCPTITRQLARAVDIAREALGPESFAVLSVGFDAPTDSPDRLRAFARERGIDVPGWRFATADVLTVKQLTRELGFAYAPSVRGFDHLTQTTIVGADGVVFDQVYGELIHAPNLVEPLKRAVWGEEAKANTLTGWVQGVKLFCTVYDPNTGRYTFDYSIFITLVIGIASLSAVAGFALKHWWETGRAAKKGGKPSAGIRQRLFRL